MALPVLAEQLLAMLVGFSDTVIAGRYLEEPHLAAMNLMAYLLWLAQGVFAVIAIGATAMVARFVGAGDRVSARRTVNQAFILGAALAAVATAAAGWAARDAVGLVNLEGASAALAVRYIYCILPALPLIMMEAVGIACLRGAGDMIAGLLIMVAVNTVNIVVSWSLVLGIGPLPRLGWEGLAIGTSLGYCSGGLLAAGLLIRGRSGLHLNWRRMRPDLPFIRRLLWIGVPGGADMLSIIGCQLWFVALINQLGDLAAAAHGVAIRVESLAYLPGAAFQVAAATLAGQYLGARDHHRASRSVITALLVGGGLMMMAAMAFFFAAPQLAMLLVGGRQARIALAAAPLLQTIAVAMPALALNMILSGALRGAGDTRWPLAFTIVGFVGVRLPVAYWLCFDTLSIPGTNWTLSGWGLGIQGAWYAMVVDLAVRATLVLYRFWHGGWRRIDV
ncbi:MAG: MATE family efflux transporter [Thermoguttaceae bacterium]|nr:MATE family efflux transporter [Thermoguttaceae bacterium]